MNAFPIATVLFEPGTMQVEGAEQKWPGCFFRSTSKYSLSRFLSSLDAGIQMRILFSHNNFPAQFRRLAPALAEQGHDVVFLAQNREWHAPPSAGVRLKEYVIHRHGGGEALHPYLRRFESCVLHGQAVYRACEQLKQEGWEPDWIVNHVGFGNGLYLRDAFPGAQRIGLFEWYYNSSGADVDFLRRGSLEPDRALRLRTWNAQTLLEIADCDYGVVPTYRQLEQFPLHLRSRLQVIHEGIDLDNLSPQNQRRKRPSSLPSGPEVEVLTYVSRGFEEYEVSHRQCRPLLFCKPKGPICMP